MEAILIRVLSITVLPCICLTPVWRSVAASSSSNPTADAFVTTGGPAANLSANNYGGAGALSVAAPGLAQGEFQSVLQFSLATAKSSFDSQFGAGQWSIQSATLQLTATSPNNAIFNSSAAGQLGISFMQNNSWTEGTGTPASPSLTGISFSTLNSFLSAGDEALGNFSFNGATSGNVSCTLGLTPSFMTDILAGNNVSLRLFADDSTVSGLFDSRSFGTTSARPVLTVSVSVVPEPGSLALGLAGLICFFGQRALR